MTDIDGALANMRGMPIDPRLAAIDAAVFAEVARAGRSRPVPGSVFGLAAVAALSAGILGSTLPNSAATAAPVAPFGSSPALAPSALLSASE